ncbi:uncharacterized protein FIBRA_00700 [Fibroporia radiculosa]|uniref:Uncharacterized protein n=1 Tax=Fibroporia radiculosa TaxID=599839 RepID=J4I830_9APHY|nr:uncharacterized protein FIBRA_00700 [Fibroporia radiculosa]CCL98696.1 predicted protein [Fibroporia radiculosa]
MPPSPSPTRRRDPKSRTLYLQLHWEGQVDMQKLLDMFPSVQPNRGAEADMNVEAMDFSSALDVELGGWDLDASLDTRLAQEVGVF